jgi:hypothetical protein
MNTPNKSKSKSNKNKLPEWQSVKMRTLIEQQWSEVWKIVIARERSSRNSAENLLLLRN